MYFFFTNDSRDYFKDFNRLLFFLINAFTHCVFATFFSVTSMNIHISNFVNSHVDIDTYRRTFVNAITKGDRTHNGDEEGDGGGSRERRRGENSRGK